MKRRTLKYFFLIFFVLGFYGFLPETFAQQIKRKIDEQKTNTIIKRDTGYFSPRKYKGYKLKWADEFNAATLNLQNWSFENGNGCPTLCGWGNNELQYYKPENTRFKNGKMIIEAKKEDFGNKNFTSSKIVTKGRQFFKYGRIDMRAKLPYGQGVWPAFWMLPQNTVYGSWPKSGEIDIMEMIGKEPSKNYGTLHFGPGPGSTQLGRNVSLSSGIFNESFHVFSLEWNENEIQWLLDGRLYSTYNKKEFGAVNYPFNEEFFLIINLAVGGNWPGNPDVSVFNNQTLEVDYVRVFEKKK